MRITSSTLQPNKNQDGWNWNLELQLLSPEPSVDPTREVTTEQKFFFTCACQPGAAKDGKVPDPDGFKRMIADAQDAIRGSDDITTRPTFDREFIPSCEGREVIAVVFHDTWQGEKKAKIKRLEPATA